MNKKKLGMYGLPTKVEYCSNCTRSNQRPHNIGEFLQNKNKKKTFVGLSKNKICNACSYYFEKQNINWKKREKELRKICDKYRKNNGDYDVIVPGSGGKDSIYVAHELRFKYKMKPLLVTWAPNMTTNIGKKNFLAWKNLSKNNIYIKQNNKVHRLLTKLAFINLCHPFQPFVIGQKNVAPKLALKKNIKLVMFGEHDAEFGMMMNTKNKPDLDVSHFCSDQSYDELFISGLKIKELISNYNLTLRDLEPYLPLKKKDFLSSGIKFHYFSYYKKWNFHDNYYFAVENSEFKPSDLKIEGSYDKYASMDDKLDWLHFYTFYTKFGMGRATSASDQEIRSGVITRDEGIALVRRFDGEFIDEYFDDILKYLDISKNKFFNVIDKFRPPHLWKKEKNSWKLRYPIWEAK